MKIIDGKLIAVEIQNKLKLRIDEFKKKNITPGLGIILVGNDPASEIYVRNKMRVCSELGVNAVLCRFNEENTEEEIIKQIEEFNQNEEIDGILVQSPLPSKFVEEKIISHVSPLKDVDGFGIYNLGALLSNQEKIIAATPLGILKMLEHENIRIEGRHVVVVGAGLIVGRPMAALLLNRGATVTLAHSKTQNLKEITRQADILIVAIGDAQFITDEYVKDGAVVIDVGTNRVDGKLYGDVDFLSVAPKTSYITPVPGGVGPMTIVMLIQNVVDVCERKSEENGSKN